MSQQCHNSVTKVSQQCHNSVTTVSQQCHNSVTTVSQQCHNSVTTVSQQCHNIVTTQNYWFFRIILKLLKCYTFLRVQRRHNCSPATSFANCVMTLHLLKVHLQMFISIPITQKCQILSCDTHVANKRYFETYRSIIREYNFIVVSIVDKDYLDIFHM